MTELIVRLSDEAATNAVRFGPKAANQALLGRAGLPIPSGFCLDAEAYRLQLKALGLEEVAAAAGRLEGADARPQIAEGRIALFERPITPSVLKPWRNAWQELLKDPGG